MAQYTKQEFTIKISIGMYVFKQLKDVEGLDVMDCESMASEIEALLVTRMRDAIESNKLVNSALEERD
jgi:hypothetical protein